MEKKTIGSFIAVLRKSQGMTQRELAEKLCVSDKAVSRWERDEAAPDLTLIPIIADIFGVTCDEILRGEKFQNANSGGETDSAPKKSSEKQLKHLINMNLGKFKKQLWIVLGTVTAGIVACVTLWLTGHATYGMGIGVVFAIAAAVCLGIFSSGAASFTDTEDLDEESVLSFKREVYRKTFHGAFYIVASICFELFLLIFVLGFAESNYEILLIPALLIVYFLIYFIATAVFNKKYCEKLKIPASRQYNSALKLKTFVAGLLVAAILTGSIVTAYNLPARCFSKGTTFETAEEFKTYMRNYGYENTLWISEDGEDRNVPDGYSKRYFLTNDPDEFDCIRYKKYEIVQEDGKEIDETGFWYYENDHVDTVVGNSLNLPITCYNYKEKRENVLKILGNLTIIFCSLDVVLCFAVYFKKRKKIRKIPHGAA